LNLCKKTEKFIQCVKDNDTTKTANINIEFCVAILAHFY